MLYTLISGLEGKKRDSFTATLRSSESRVVKIQQ